MFMALRQSDIQFFGDLETEMLFMAGEINKWCNEPYNYLVRLQLKDTIVLQGERPLSVTVAQLTNSQ